MSLTRDLVTYWIESGNLDGLRNADPVELDKHINKEPNLNYDNHALLATKNGHADVLRFLHERGVPINGVGVGGTTLMNYAAEYGHVNVMEFLIAKEMPINGAQRTAAAKGRLNVLEFLSEHGVAMDEADEYGYTAAHNAVVNDRTDVLEFLHALSVPIVGERSDRGLSPIQLACVHGSLNALRYFKMIGARFDFVDDIRGSLAHVAAHNGNTNVLQFLIEQRASLDRRDQDGNTVMHLAAISGEVSALELLYDAGVSVNGRNDHGHTPLHSMIRAHFDEDVAQFLVSKGADVNSLDNVGETPLFEAVRTRTHAATSFLCRFGADVNVRADNGETPLFEVIDTDDSNDVSLLCAAGADVNARDTNGITPGLRAVARGYVATIKHLHRFGADFTLCDENGWGAAYHAVFWQFPRLLRLLKGFGVPLSAPTNLGETALHYSVRLGRTECVRALIELGEPVVIQTLQFSRTPFAVLTDQTPADVIRMMVASGAPGPDDDDGIEKLRAKATDSAEVAALKRKLEACPTRIERAFAAAAELEGGVDFVLRAIMNRVFDDELDSPVVRAHLAAYGRSLTGAQGTRELTPSETKSLELVPRLARPPGPTNFEFLPPLLKDQIRTLLLIGKRAETLKMLEALPFLPPELWIMIFSQLLLRQGPPPLPPRRTAFVHIVL
jgi:ankyrin repeat protein